MLSFTSSSRERAPRDNGLLVLLVSGLISISILLLVETRLYDAGAVPSVHDSLELWSVQRTRASKLGDKALIIVGASRTLVGIDLETLRQKTGLEPVQLSIDGSGFLPVLEDLAIDPRVTGTVLVSVTAGKVVPEDAKDRAREWVSAYNGNYRGLFSPTLEARIRSFLSEHLSFYASPIPSQLFPALLFQGKRIEINYITYRNRQVEADYSSVRMPEYYINRVLRHLGGVEGGIKFTNLEGFNTYLEEQIDNLQVASQADFLKGVGRVALLAEAIHSHGGKVILLRMPTDKLILEIDEKRYPRRYFWDVLAAVQNTRAIHFEDYPGLQFMDLPDGSHIDIRDKALFTGNLATILFEEGVQGAGPD